MADEPQVITVIRLTLEVLWAAIRVVFGYLVCIFQHIVPPTPRDVSNEIVLITGTGHGMGRAVALRLGRLGATIVCVDINKQNNDETVELIKQEKGKAYGYICDVTDRAAVFDLAAKVQREVGIVTVLLNNAGIMPCKPILRQSEKEIRLMNDINIHGVLWGIQAFLPNMLERNYGHIISMSSMAGLMGLRNIVPYCGSKFAVKGIMEALRVELHEDPRDFSGIKLTTVYPTMVNTGLCKKPNLRFEKLLNVVDTDQAADAIVDAIRRQYTEISIPADLFYSNKLYRLLPISSALVCTDLLGTGLDPDDV
ncbi:epidermal retinol dehydrogenase 2-like isoform X3 [Galleria mellonella]|uniref:Epidermal retinol dehydrogenase 2-like isoform X2 n=1 Tax=Galleria mellonella TaxID=7137 RepID=A0ABM3MG58_GALME|nr:epidermal retinol dehydrogenase 2-like isoform X2 [Galleria mellonella]XP_052750145.1 epidermal retinol dehydrogenase 2-like isoform X3 [Galleria mellonella]